MKNDLHPIFGARYKGVYLLEGVRTPFGKFCGALGRISPTDLGIIVAREVIRRAKLQPDQIDHVVFANIIQSGFDAIYLPRHIGLYAEIPQTTPALLVQRICGSGFEAIIAATEQIVLGKAQVVLAGGTENMTLAPTSSFGNRMGYRLGQLHFGDMLWEGLLDPAVNCSMGQTAENLAKKYSITRTEVDDYAFQSHQRAKQRWDDGTLAKEVIPVASGVHQLEGLVPRKFKTIPTGRPLERDEYVRTTEREQLDSLRPSFVPDGVQTAGNSSGIVDGAAAVIVTGEEFVKHHDQLPLARIVASASAGVDPQFMGLGPVPSIHNLLQLTGLAVSDIALWEINEAFGAQIVAVERELGLDRERLNVNGGSIAIGHPLAATGTRLTHTLALELRRRGERYGIASACIGGGQGTAVLIENTAVDVQ
ncbi:MAG: thiolase family protein [Fidelibacterota bacterium]